MITYISTKNPKERRAFIALAIKNNCFNRHFPNLAAVSVEHLFKWYPWTQYPIVAIHHDEKRFHFRERNYGFSSNDVVFAVARFKESNRYCFETI